MPPIPRKRASQCQLIHSSPPDGASLSPVVQALFPQGVIAAERRAPGDVALLFPEEAACVHRAVDKRVREFAAGRACARRALAEFGLPDFKLLTAPDRQPIWPPSVVGSITHTSGYCAAIAAAKNRFIGVGLDSEGAGHVGRDLWATIARDEEHEWCLSLPAAEQTAAMTLLFSAKEAFYKCQYPATEEWLDFHDLRIEPDAWSAAGAGFTVHFARPLEIAGRLRDQPKGRYVIQDGVVTAGIAIPRDPAGQ